MTTYTTAEAALLALIRAYSGGTVYTTSNSSAEDWTVLDASGDDACVLEMAGDTTEADDLLNRGLQGARIEVHQVGAWVCKKRGMGDGGDGAVKAAVKAATEALKDYIRPYERLNHGDPISRAQIVKTSAPSYISPTKDISAATHVAQLITVQVVCETAYTAIEEGA